MSEETKDWAIWITFAVLVGLALAIATSRPKGGPGKHRWSYQPKPTPNGDSRVLSDDLQTWLDDNFEVVPCNCG